MADYGAEYTDKKIEELEKRITSIYREASDDIERKMADFNKRYKAKEAIYAKKLKNGEITQEDFNAWKRGQVFQGKQWQAKKQQIENILYNANSVAVKMVNGETNGVFAANANFMSYSLESGAGVNFGFGLYDESTVVNLIKNEPDLLPKPRIKKPKDTAWNSKKITRQITQGIIQGESLDDIATRLAKTTGSQNRDAMLTHARTAMTGAQNAGRQYQLGKAQDLGIKLKKEWMATLDSHTRDTHRELDGQRVPINEPFEAGGYSIMYPGDPNAVPAMVYNCRCTMVADVEDYPAEYNRYDNIEGKPISNMTYAEWEAAKEKSKSSANTIINGKDISAAWKRRPDQFDFEIEDVMNAQGFDGLPRVVSPEEFDKLVKQANDGSGFIAQRTYSAPNQEILDAYRDQLYHGKWYVDCSTGGAAHGKGMYCVGNYGNNITDKMIDGMRGYGANNPFSYVETFTLEKDAKIIKEDNIKDLFPDLGNNLMKKHIDKYGLSDEDIKFIAASSGIGRMEAMTDLYMKNPQHATELMKMKAENKDFNNDVIDAYNEFLNLSKDNGVVATMFGYDAIDCGRIQDYFVILNRTKCIFKGE